jgi:hypothetical protein
MRFLPLAVLTAIVTLQLGTPDGASAATERQFKAQARTVARQLGTAFDRRFQRPLVVRFSSERPTHPTDDPVPAVTTAARRVGGRWVRVTDGRMEACLVRIFPIGQALTGVRARGLLAHEITHCLQYELLGVAAARRQKKWLMEGAAEWVSYDQVGGVWDTLQYWRRYATIPSRPLFRRDYDAIGFFAHVARQTNGYRAIIAITRAAGHDGSEGAFRAAQRRWGRSRAKQHRFLRVWATSSFRDAELGPDWELRGPGLPDDALPDPEIVEPDAQLFLDKPKQVSVRVYDLVAVEGLVVRVAGRGYGALRWHDASQETRFDGQFDTTYCIRQCACPAGMKLDPAIQTVAADSAAIALTPGLGVPGAQNHDGILQIQARAPADACIPAAAGTAVRLDPCALYSVAEARALLRAIVPPSIPVENVTGGLPRSPRPTEPVSETVWEECMFISSFGDAIFVDQLREDSPQLLRDLATYERVDGVGDGGYFFRRSRSEARLFFWVGPALLSVHFLVLPDAPRAQLTSLARTIAGRARGVCC